MIKKKENSKSIQPKIKSPVKIKQKSPERVSLVKNVKNENPQNTVEKKLKIKEIEEAGLFEAFESILKSYYNGGAKKDVNIFEFSIHRIKAFESHFKSKIKKNEIMQKYKIE